MVTLFFAEVWGVGLGVWGVGFHGIVVLWV